jgi:hypothetical protein
MNFDIKHAKIVRLLLNSWRRETRTLLCGKNVYQWGINLFTPLRVGEANEIFFVQINVYWKSCSRFENVTTIFPLLLNFFIPRPLLIETIVTRCLLLFLLIHVTSIATLHVRIHLKHFKLLLYIRNFAHSNDNFATILKHGVDCSIDEHRDRSIGGLRWMRLIFCFLSTSRWKRKREKKFIDQ